MVINEKNLLSNLAYIEEPSWNKVVTKKFTLKLLTPRIYSEQLLILKLSKLICTLALGMSSLGPTVLIK